MSSAVLLESDLLRVHINPRVGGTITAIQHKQLGLSVLGKTPWEPIDTPLDSVAAPDEAVWLTRYGGGWPLLFPNGGDACLFDGNFHGFHGEASISPWEVESHGSILRLVRCFKTVPVRLRREMTVEGDLLTVRETAEADGQQPVTVMWGHHPTFGSDLLDGAFEVQSGAETVRVDQSYDPATNPLQPGAVGKWPLVQGKTGMFDLEHPAQGGDMAALAFLQDFASPWISIRRLDNAVAVALSWDADVFPYAWVWYELGGTADAPWLGRGRLIGLEPNTTCSAAGLADAHHRGERLLVLQPGVPVTATVRLQVFKPSGVVRGVDAAGRAVD